MKKFSLLLMLALFTIVAQAWTVNFTNPDKWSTVNVYTFDPECSGTWPGSKMTKNGDVWTYTGTGNPNKIIFNYGNAQTGDLDFVDGATYNMIGVVGAETHIYKIGFNNSNSWENVYVYTWGPKTEGEWPGKKLTKNSDGNYYLEIEATSEPTCNVIFNNNSNAQTPDIAFKDGAVFNAQGNEVGVPTTKYTMSLNNTANWAKVYVYTFNPEVCGSWPGKELTKGSDGYYTFEYESTSAPSFGGIIFNDGSDNNKTGDLPFENGKVVTNGGGDVPPTPAKDLYLVGGPAGWNSANEAYKFNRDGNVYTLELAEGLKGTWKIWDGTWDYNFGGNGTSLVSGEEADAWFNSGADFNSDFAGKTTIVFTLVSGSDVKDSSIPSKITVTAESVAEPDPMEEWWVSAQGIAGNWEAAGVHPDSEGLATIPALSLYGNSFKIKVWNGLSDAWYSNGSELALETPTVVDYNSDNNMTVAGLEDNKIYTIMFNVISKELTVVEDVITGIDSINVSEEAPIYFNLQGIKVEKPANGIYVKVANGKASRVVVK